MAKAKGNKGNKKKADSAKKKSDEKNILNDSSNELFGQMGKELPEGALRKIDDIKRSIDSFKEKIIEKFDKYIMGVALFPPDQNPEGDVNKDKINVFVLIDDSDSKKMPKEELKEKISGIIATISKEVNDKLSPQVMLISEVWQMCYDAKYDILDLIAKSAPIYDTGMLQAIKISEIHKKMTLEKFEKYIVSYVLAGSLVQGKATSESDIDVFIVIDDTDVKKMTRTELRDKLRAIIISMGLQAGELTGIKNKLNIQVYILTDFWESIKDVSPVIFTFLRDGVPFYDRGIYMPWKQLLEMGKIKPSKEAIDMYMDSGEKILQRAEDKIKEIGTEDTFWATLTPSQAAIMMYGLHPPTPKETPELMRQVFVKKEKILEEEYIKILENNIKTRKDIEHGVKKSLSGNELDKLITDSKKFLKRINRLFEEIAKRKEKESLEKIYDDCMEITKKNIKFVTGKNVKDEDVLKEFKANFVDSGELSNKDLADLKQIFGLDVKNIPKMNSKDIDYMQKIGSNFIRKLIDYYQRQKLNALEKVRLGILYENESLGEIIVLGNDVFIMKEKGNEDDLLKAILKSDGGFDNPVKAKKEELNIEENLAKFLHTKILINTKFLDSVKKVFGADAKILFA